MTRQELIDNIYRKGTFLCVGLDTDPRKLPEHLLEASEDPVFAFNKDIIDSTAQYCVAYKPNLAFYEAAGPDGMRSFIRTVEYLRQRYPKHLIIADAKRGDIGNTSKLYAREFFENDGVDAVTVAPYMGVDSVSPFFGYGGKWVVLLALTSNPGSMDFQMMRDADTGDCLFEKVIKTSQTWTEKPEEHLMYVVGATRGNLFPDVRRLAPKAFLLVPGVGAQGGSLEEVVQYGFIPGECGLLVNSSRGIIYASSGPDFAEAAGEAAADIAAKMRSLMK